jgi:uncharacterized protein YecT (DUF1311 family)
MLTVTVSAWVVVSLVGGAPSSAKEGTTQTELNEQSCARYKYSDAELNKVYREVLELKQADANLLGRLKAAQWAWMKFRDARLGELFPDTSPARAYGSMYPSCRCGELEELTRARIAQLREWLDAKEDICAGSRTPSGPEP